MEDHKSIIQRREYQEVILKKLKSNFEKNQPTIAEIDTGMGKRVLTYLLMKEILSTQRILLLLHSTASFLETIHYFTQIYGGFVNDSEFGHFSSKTSGWIRKKILENSKMRIIASTPQTFANAFNKISGKKPVFDVIIINEIDKIVRRQGDSRLLIFPYNTILPYFINKGAWILGMTGTIRDSHIFYNMKENKIQIQNELFTLDSRIPNLQLISMDSLIKETDISNYIHYTSIQRYAIECSQELKTIFDLIDQGIQNLRENIIEETKIENPSLIEAIPKNQLALVSGMLETSERKKYQGLLLIRKYCTAMQPNKYKKFLYRLKKYGITKEFINSIPKDSSKITACLSIINEQTINSKSVILCSYLDTAYELIEKIKNYGTNSYLITGKIKNKDQVLNLFKNDSNKAVLVMSSVGERDIDIPQANLLILYDVVNTVKTVYQRMKRTRGGKVLCLYYRGTFEEKKVERLLEQINKRYPWSSIIETDS